jgi:hypothetical protein
MKIYKPCATLLPAIAKGRDKLSDWRGLKFLRVTAVWHSPPQSSLKKFILWGGVDFKCPPLFEEKVFGAYTLPLGDRCRSKGYAQGQIFIQEVLAIASVSSVQVFLRA